LRVDAMRARARGLGDGVESELSVIVDTLFPIATVGAALAEMRAAYPSVGVRLAVEPMGGPIGALTERRSALAVTVGEDFRDPRLALDAICAVQIARNDARHVISFSRRVSPELCLSSRPLWKQRAQGMPGARCTRGLACKGRKRNAHEHTGSAGDTPAFPAQWLYGLYVLTPARLGSFVTALDKPLRVLRGTPAVRASGLHDFAVRTGTFVSCAGAATASHRNTRDDREAPLNRMRRADNKVSCRSCKQNYFGRGGLTGF
jgi:hypothetical protein